MKPRVDETQLKHHDAGRLSSNMEAVMVCFCAFETSYKLPEVHAHDTEVEVLVSDLNPTLPASFHGRIGREMSEKTISSTVFLRFHV